MRSLQNRTQAASVMLWVLVLFLALLGNLSFAQDRKLGDRMRTATPVADERRVALVIGNSNYRALPKLFNPRNDAHDMCDALTRLRFTVFCVIDAPTRRALRDQVRQFATKLQPGSLAVFYYAGHGVQFRSENFLLPTDMEANSSADIEDEALSLSYVLRTLEDARSAPNIVILDACRDNPFSRPGEIGAGRGLARTEPPLGTVLVYATAPNSVAIDGTGRNGLFTKHLLAQLPRPGIKLDEMLQIVAKSVEDEARAVYRRDQVPYRSSSFAGDLCLVSCDSPQLSERIEQITRQSEEATRRIKELSDENARLRDEAQQRAVRIADMEARIARLNEASSKSGAHVEQTVAELKQLRQELEIARQGQREREQAVQKEENQQRQLVELRSRLAGLQKQADELAAAGRNQRSNMPGQGADARTLAELAELRNRLSALQTQAEQIDDYRRQIQLLQKENEEKTRLLEERQKRPEREPPEKRRSPVVVPSF